LALDQRRRLRHAVSHRVQIRYVGLVNVAPFRIAVAVHNWTGFVLIVNFFLWLGFYLSSDRIRVYHAELNPVKCFRGVMRQIVYYSYGILKGLPDPFRPSVYSKFNPLQAMTYQILMLIVLPIEGVTGVLLSNLSRFSGIVAFFGGVRVIDTVHVLIFIFFAFYLPAHAYLGTLGRTPMQHYKEMATGYEEEEGEGGGTK
jgi:thiosulfate reductase cytochrome b subunit